MAKTRFYGREEPVPYLLLRGRWLERAGFTPGTLVTVQVGWGRLTVSRREDSDEQHPREL